MASSESPFSFSSTSSFKEKLEKVNRWREALVEAPNLPGWGVDNDTNGYEAELIKRVVNDVTSRLGKKPGWTDAISASEQEQNNADRDMVDFLKSGWTLLMTNLILEMTSAVFDQLGNALVGMVLAFVALLLSTAELIYMERMSTIVGAVRQCFYSTVEYARQKKDNQISILPISHRPSTTTLSPGKPVGTIVEYFGWVGAVWQCVHSTVAYAYARQKKDNPIKMCLLPSIFLLCVVISKLIKKSHID